MRLQKLPIIVLPSGSNSASSSLHGFMGSVHAHALQNQGSLYASFLFHCLNHLDLVLLICPGLSVAQPESDPSLLRN